jgi:hypothetical protein
MTTLGTVVGSLRVNLRVRGTRFLGVRGWIAAKLCGLAAAILGGELIVEAEPDIATEFRHA